MTATTPTDAVPSGSRPAAAALLGRLAAAQRRVPLLQIAVLVALVLYAGHLGGAYGWTPLIVPMLLLSSFLGIAGAGQTLVVLVGGLDLSIPAYIAAGDLLVAHLCGDDHWNFAPAALLILAICAAGGSLCGFLCHRFALEPLVITLAMSSIVTGVLLGSNSRIFSGSTPQWLQTFTATPSRTFGLPVPPAVAVWLVLVVVITVVLARTPAGRKLYLTGAGPRAAQLARVRTGRVWVAAYACSALLAGIAGILLAGFSGSGDSSVGQQYLFESLAAVIVGGTMMGGRGDYPRTVLGALIVIELTTVILGLNLSAAAQQVVFGVLILLVVALYGRERRLRDRV